jgi:hypothetical protein
MAVPIPEIILHPAALCIVNAIIKVIGKVCVIALCVLKGLSGNVEAT